MALKFSNIQTEAIRKLIEGLEELLQGQVFTLYGEEVIDPSRKIEKLEQDLSKVVENTDNLTHLINGVQPTLTAFADSIADLNKSVFDLQHIIRPDETDTHNINRRQERLAQRVALLESNAKKRWRK